MRIRRSFFVFALLFCSLSALDLKAAKCSDLNGPVAALIKSGPDAPSKTPLILIHGIQATTDSSNVETDNKTWAEFLKLIDAKDSQLNGRFSVYLFQYCSDRVTVSALGDKLRDLIDQKIPDRPHVIVAHSMGGLIAKSYIGRTEHIRGLWKGKKSGETVSALITLATPHHGTPGANDPITMKKFVPDKFEAIYNAVQQYYWRANKGSVRSPSLPNRSDLRWDNYDGKLDSNSNDVNTDLAKSNLAFEPYAAKLTAYGGTTAATLSKFETATLLLEMKLGGSKSLSEHRLLSFANIGLVNGLDRHFGDADGLVPLASSLFCKPESSAMIDPFPQNYLCFSTSRVRRFETGRGGEVAAAQLPEKYTLSIFRSTRGFDHLDMLTHADVLRYLIKDLATMAPAKPGKPLVKTTRSPEPALTGR